MAQLGGSGLGWRSSSVCSLQAELEVSKHESSTKCRQPRALLTELGEENSKLASETWSNMEFGSKDHGPSLNGNFADCALLRSRGHLRAGEEHQGYHFDERGGEPWRNC